MIQLRRRKRDQEGSALVAVLGFTALILILVLTSLIESTDHTKNVAHHVRKHQALYICELGVNLAAAKINDGQDANVDATIGQLEQLGSVVGQGGPIGTGGLEVIPTTAVNTDQDEDGYLDFEDGQSFNAQRALFAERASGSFAVRARAIGDAFKVRVMAVYDGHVRVIETFIEPDSFSVFSGYKGFIGLDTVSIDAAGFVDSYVSGGADAATINGGASADAYAPESKNVTVTSLDGSTTDTGEERVYENSNVVVGANNSVDIAADNTIAGLTVVGPSGDLNAADESLVVPEQLTEELPADLPEFTVPPVGSANNTEISGDLLVDANNFNVPANANYTLGTAGQTKVYVFDKFSTKEAATGTIQGNVEIYITDTMRFAQDTVLNLAPGATLKIYTEGAVQFDQDLSVNAGGFPLALQIISNQVATGSDDAIVLENFDNPSSTFVGAINAPGVAVEIKQDAEFFGAIRGREINMEAGGTFHFDESLNDAIRQTYNGSRFQPQAILEIR